MRHFLWALATLLLLGNISAGGATERRLPPAPALAQTLQERPAAASAFRKLRQAAAERGSARVIVGLRVPFAPEGRLGASETAQQRADIAGRRSAVLNRLSDAGPRNARSFDALPFVAMQVTAADLDALTADPNVVSVAEDRQVQLQLAESVPLIQGDLAWAAGYRGLGQTVAIIDTGVDKTHPFLFGKVVSEACFSAGGWCPGGVTSSIGPGSARPCPHPDCIHGTHVAGIAAGSGFKFSGVAKDASIIAIQVMSPGGRKATAYTSDLIAALLRVYQLRTSFRIAAVNMSLGTTAVSPDSCDKLDSGYDDPLKLLIDLLRSVDIATVISSGNSYSAGGISWPACISSAVSVGAVSDTAVANCTTGVDQVACYSNSAPMLSLLAPGSLITSSVPGRRYAAMHGTSMAAPHVAGAWALIKEKKPDAPVADVLNALQATGKRITDARNGVVKPRINAKAALDQFADGRFALSFVKAGTAQGTVSFAPAGTVDTCRQDCFNRFDPGTLVTLTATPDPGATFYGWGGACSGTGTCTVTMSSAKNVAAGFYASGLLSLTYGQSGGGGGKVSFSMPGFDSECGASCTQTYWKNATVTLTAHPAPGSYFAGWSGVCRGTKDVCSIRLSKAKAVSAVFETLPHYVLGYTRQGTGNGSVGFGVAGVAPCADSCSNSITAGTEVTLTAVAETGSEFVGWSGACRGPKQTCTLVMTGDKAVGAEFRTTAAASASR